MNAKQILDTIKQSRGLKTDKALADFLGLKSKNLLSLWKKRNSVNLKIILAKCRDLDKNLLFGATAAGCEVRDSAAPKYGAFKKKKTPQASREKMAKKLDRIQRQIEELKEILRKSADQ